MSNIKPLDPLREVIKKQLERSIEERNLFREKFLKSKPKTHEESMAYFNLAISTGSWTATEAMRKVLNEIEKLHPDL